MGMLPKADYHEQAPLSLAQRCSAVPATLPLFTAILNYRHSKRGSAPQDEPSVGQAWEGIRWIKGEERTNYPIGLSVDDQDEGFILTPQCVSTIDPSRIAAYVQTAIEGLVDALEHNPNKTTDQIGILPSTERNQLLREFNDTTAPYPHDQLIHQLFEAQADLQPDAIALVYEDQELSYGDLNQRANLP
jgi:hypothetical protein